MFRTDPFPNDSNDYDTRARMLGTWLRKNDGTLLIKHEYQLNDMDRLTKQTRTAGDYVEYAYDPLGQLTNAVGKELGGVTNRWQEQFSYGYDAAGNLTNRIQHRLTNSFTVNSLNQLTGRARSGRFSVGGTTTGPATNVTVNTSNSVLYLDYTFASTNHSLANGTNTFTAVGKDSYGRIDTNISTTYLPESPTYAYDGNGNLTNDSQQLFGYDEENQLTNVMVANAWKSEFMYDGKMRRRIRREFTWVNGAWVQTDEVRYIYDGNLVIQERDTFNLADVSFTRGTDLSGSFQGAGGIGGLLAFSQHATLNPQHAYYYADGNGNVTTLIDTNQTIVARYAYEPFGNVFSMSGPVANANLYRFSSKEAHSRCGLIYYLYRFYDPGVQRWVNRDPLGERGGLNLYKALANDPLTTVDKDGRVIQAAAICALVKGIMGKRDSPQKKTRYAHCLASCYIAKACGKPVAMAAGLAKELKDLAHCLLTHSQDKDHCYSAFQPSDFEDNETGQDCPPKESCKDRCKHLLDDTVTEPPEGPFYIEDPVDMPPNPGMSGISPNSEILRGVV